LKRKGREGEESLPVSALPNKKCMQRSSNTSNSNNQIKYMQMGIKYIEYKSYMCSNNVFPILHIDYEAMHRALTVGRHIYDNNNY
jgi:hypothetical protein